MIRIAICDDVLTDIKALKDQLILYRNQKKINFSIDSFTSAKQFLSHYKQRVYDLVFMDVMLKKQSGLELAKELRKTESLPIILYSSSPDFAIDGYEINISGYITKPLNKEKLFNYLNRFFTELPRKKVEIPYHSNFIYLYVDELIYCESVGRKIKIKLKNKNDEIISFYGKLDDLEKTINDNSMLRTHKSFLVNMNYIESIDGAFFVLKDKTKIPIRKKDLNSLIGDYHTFFLQDYNYEY